MKRVGILRGGKNDYENSIEKGGELISHIVENLSDRWKVVDIFIDKDGNWHLSGKQIQPADLIHKVDVVWNVAHPSFSNVIQSFSIPCIGSNFFSSYVEKNRPVLEEHMKKIGVKMPRHFIIPPYQKDFDGEEYKFIIKKAKEVHQKFSAPWIVRSFVNNSSMGIHVAETFPKLVEAIEDGVNHDASILVEELISGKNAFMHTVSNFRDEDVYAFPAGNFSDIEKDKLIYWSKELHKHLGSFHYLKSNFVLHPKKGIFLTSVEFSPNLKQDSHFNKVCKSVGAETHNVVESILNSVL
jgi:D-alanine-D-alanine ligase-like ATP-grasp enzyme